MFLGHGRNYVLLFQMNVYAPTVQLSAIALTCVRMRHVTHWVGPLTRTPARQTHAIGAASYSTSRSRRRKSALVGKRTVTQWRYHGHLRITVALAMSQIISHNGIE